MTVSGDRAWGTMSRQGLGRRLRARWAVLLLAVAVVGLGCLAMTLVLGAPASSGVGAAAAGPTASPSPRPSTATCRTSLQALVDAAAPRSTVIAPPCVYRGTLTITKPLTLRAAPGAEIRGSDVWTAWSDRVSTRRLPVFPAHGACLPGADCLSPEQVFVDGAPLVRVAADPRPGEFALDDQRHVVLGQDPSGHLIEVSTRARWVVVRANDVTLDGLIMRDAVTDAQEGALQLVAGNRLTIEDCDLSFAHGAAVAFGGGNDSLLQNCSIHDNGQLGVHLGGDGGTNGHNNRVVGSHIYHNNTAGFSPEWEAGGLKATVQSGLVLDRNEVEGNVGPGLWCDIYCRNVTISHNRVHDNTYAGIMFEISTGAKIFANAAYANGFGRSPGAGGPGSSFPARAAPRSTTTSWPGTAAPGSASSARTAPTGSSPTPTTTSTTT